MVALGRVPYDAGTVTLHDWIDELCDVLDIDVEVDEGLILDLARVVARTVERPATPISTFLLGYAAAVYDADPEKVEMLAARVQALAEKWDGNREISPDDFNEEDLVGTE